MSQKSVSIIIRSMGRPELAEALSSLAAQGYPDLEVVVVAACGSDHPSVPSSCGAHRVRFVPGEMRRPRAVAANAGLDACTGELIGLLDDDDLQLPQHVARLSAAMDAFPDAPAAYSIAREVDGAGNVTGRRAQPYSHFLLFQDCYIAPASVLFRRSALATCRFDERFEICEDWDFWLQLAELGRFTFLPVETAIYRSSLGTSGTGPGAQRVDERYRQYTALLAEKWQQRGIEIASGIDALVQDALGKYGSGDHRGAEALADSVLAEYPFDVTALNLKGTLLAQRSDYAAACTQFEIAAREAPDDVASHVNLAQALEHLAREDDALAEYRHVLRIAPHYTHAAARAATLQRTLAQRR
ncbi:MAG TPA: glycosyltransferase [Casimicrobiaceae bacterium]|nr:glycosyltransferase [Casimicrobiaceae bacterium]